MCTLTKSTGAHVYVFRCTPLCGVLKSSMMMMTSTRYPELSSSPNPSTMIYRRRKGSDPFLDHYALHLRITYVAGLLLCVAFFFVCLCVRGFAFVWRTQLTIGRRVCRQRPRRSRCRLNHNSLVGRTAQLLFPCINVHTYRYTTTTMYIHTHNNIIPIVQPLLSGSRLDDDDKMLYACSTRNMYMRFLIVQRICSINSRKRQTNFPSIYYIVCSGIFHTRASVCVCIQSAHPQERGGG